MSKLSPIVKAVIYTMIYTAYFSQSVMMRHSRRLSMTSNSKATSFDLAGKQATSVLLSSVKSLKGVGPKTIDMLKNLGIINIADALFHFPTSIIDRTKRTLISKAVIGSVVTLELTVIQEKKGFNGSPHIFQCMDEDKVIVNVKCFYQKGQTEQIIWNNLRKLYKPNSQVIISGKLQLNTYSGDFDIVPEVALPASEDKAVIEKAFRVEPVYGLTQGLTNKKMRSIIEDSLLQLSGESESLASDWMLLESRNKRSWPTHMEAFKTLHTPLTNECLQINSPARTRLAHDELMTQFLHQAEKMREKKEDPLYILASELDFSVDGSGLYTSKLEDILPFKLTTCQRTAMDEVWKDMAGRSRMSRLVQGDVGSGKTVVAIMAILRAIEDGKQGAMLAPTEILAKQHYEVLSKYFEAISDAKPDSRKLRVELITGTVKGKVRLQLLDDLKNGLVDALVGTHALLGEAVADSFPSLGIVVIDEDQKFGVNQRDSLALRANTLFTTATPIPRSLMLLLVDGYSVSSLIEKPPLKRPIKTIILGSSLTDKIITRLGAHIPNGSKVFWVAPSIIARGNSVGFSVTERFAQLSALFPGQVGMIHGQLSSEEKQAAMDSFSKPDSEIKILVATSVIEVGVDVPDCSFCIIDQADSFGIAQLHQIRGRIGRGAPPPMEELKECFCVLLYDDSPENNTETNDAIKVPGTMDMPIPDKLLFLANTSDGFEIAEADLKLRGAGKLFGLEQSGFAGYRAVSIMDHSYLLKDAQQAAVRILAGTYSDLTMLDERVINLQALYPAPSSSPTTPVTRTKVAVTTSDAVKLKEPSKLKSPVKSSGKYSSFVDLNERSDVSVEEMKVVVVLLDLETSGLSPKDHRIIQIAAKTLGESSVEHYSSYVKPKGYTLDPFITELTGITAKILTEKGVTFEESWSGLKQFLKSASKSEFSDQPRPIVLITHNNPFDIGFICDELRRNGLHFNGDWVGDMNMCFVDSVTLLRDKRLWDERSSILKLKANAASVPESYKLGVIHKFVLGRDIVGAHNGVADVTAIEDILESPGLKEIWRTFANKIQHKTLPN